jgi:hypothetical protein
MRTLNDKTILLNRAEMAVMQTDPTVLRETILERAVARGKILAAHRNHYRQRYNRDRVGTVALLASLSPGITPAQSKTLHDFERQHDDEMLASARAAFPELRRQAGGAPPPVRPVASTHRAGWYRRTNGSPVVKDAGRSLAPWWQNYDPPERPTGPTPFPAGLNVSE